LEAKQKRNRIFTNYLLIGIWVILRCKNLGYDFHPSCNEIIVDFSLATQRDIDALRSRVYFGLMLDESSDISAKKQVKLILSHA
jgi:hypothetical protein